MGDILGKEGHEKGEEGGETKETGSVRGALA